MFLLGPFIVLRGMCGLVQMNHCPRFARLGVGLIFKELEISVILFFGYYDVHRFRLPRGGTDGRGHEANFELQLADHLKTVVTYFYNQTDMDELNDFHRVQIDLKLKF